MITPRIAMRHVRAARLPQPVPELQELRGGGCPAPHLAAHLTALSHPQTPDHRLFVNVQTGAALMDDFHTDSFATQPARSPRHRILPTVLANAAVRGHNPGCSQGLRSN